MRYATRVHRPRKIGFVNAANAPGTGASRRLVAQLRPDVRRVLGRRTPLHVPAPATGRTPLVNRTPWSVTKRTVQRGAPVTSRRTVTGASGTPSTGRRCPRVRPSGRMP